MGVGRVVLLGSLGVAGVVVLILGVRGTLSPNPPLQIFPDMKLQPKYRAQGENDYFPDHRDMRVPPAGTVAYGGGGTHDGKRFPGYDADAGHPTPVAEMLLLDTPQVTGMADGKPVKDIPVRLDAAVMARGREIYGFTCVACHGSLADGKGATKAYGMVPANLHDEKFVKMPAGEIFETVTKGKGSMKGYGNIIRPADRWAVIAYVRALQKSQSVTAEELRNIPGATERVGVKP